MFKAVLAYLIWNYHTIKDGNGKHSFLVNANASLPVTDAKNFNERVSEHFYQQDGRCPSTITRGSPSLWPHFELRSIAARFKYAGLAFRRFPI